MGKGIFSRSQPYKHSWKFLQIFWSDFYFNRIGSRRLSNYLTNFSVRTRQQERGGKERELSPEDEFAGFSSASRIAFARPIISRAKTSLTSMLGWPTLTGDPWTWMWWVRAVPVVTRGVGEDPRLRARASEAARRSAPDEGGCLWTRWTTFWSTPYSLSFFSSCNEMCPVTSVELMRNKIRVD